jgi:branched-chain amino acid transport system permease protein
MRAAVPTSALHGISRPTAVGIAALVLSALAVALMQATFDGYLLTLACFVGLNVMLAVSLNLTNGYTGLFSLGHPGFMTVGGYIAALLTYPTNRKSFMVPDLPEVLQTTQWDLLPALLAGGIGATLTALVIGFPVLRLRGHYLAVATLGFIIIVRVLFNNADGYTRGALGLSGMPRLAGLWWVWVFMVLTVFVCWRVKFSSLGRAMQAVRENELAARCIGISPTLVRLQAFCLGAFFAGVAGGLFAHVVSTITPGSFSILLAFNLVVMVVIGGSGSLFGAIVAAAGLSILSEALKPLEASLEAYGLSQMLIALMLIVVLIFRRQGLFGTREPTFLTGGRENLEAAATTTLSKQAG